MRSTRSIIRLGAIAASTYVLAATAACASKPPQAPESVQGAVVTGQSEGRQGRMQAMFEGITLSASQQASIDSIRADFRSRMGARSDRGDRSQMRQAMDQQRTAIRNVLTPDQQRIFDANVEKMRQERGRGRGRRSS